jgi:hypothetical protein
MKIAWSLRSIHAIFTPIRFAERAAPLSKCYTDPSGDKEKNNEKNNPYCEIYLKLTDETWDGF